jgi:nitroreductase
VPSPSSLTVRAAAESRRAIRRYIPQGVPEEDLRELLRQVRLAPSPDNLQPWRFIVIRDAGMVAQVLAAAGLREQVAAAQALIVLYADMEDAFAHLEEVIHPGRSEADRERITAELRQRLDRESMADRQRYAHGVAYIALGYLLLAAEAMGYRTAALMEPGSAGLGDLPGLPSHATIPALVAIGRGDEAGYPHHRHSVERIARFV